MGSDCVLVLSRPPSAASCLVAPLPSWGVSPKVTVQRLDGDAALEVVDDVVVGDVGDSGSCVEEVLDVGSDRSCLHMDRACRVATQCSDPWKLSMKAFLRSSHECMDSRAKLSCHVRGAGSRAIEK